MSWGKDDITRTTYFSKRLFDECIEKAALAKKDKNKKLRVQDLACKACYYFRSGRLAGQGFTQYTCPICTKSYNHPNTSTPRLCRHCAEQAVLCMECGGLRD